MSCCWKSPFPGGQGVFGWGRFRGAPLADHWLRSVVEDSGVPLVWEPFEATVVAEEFEDVEETDEDELDRLRALRGANMPMPPRPSSEFI